MFNNNVLFQEHKYKTNNVYTFLFTKYQLHNNIIFDKQQ